ncbi:MAG: phosphatidylglycerophosphatase A [Candidatus Marinimicrobia bacterium]|nr:phosphatidylglycerophosphatase A [Candidatus Neomarinimicrobiota bacterium]
MRKLAEIFATVVYIGRLPLAPGTWCSFVSLVAWYILRFWMADNFFLYGSLILFFVGVAVSTIHAETLGEDDPSEIVIDEWVGQWLALWMLPHSFLWGLVAFVFFRIFDIFKPGPVQTMGDIKSGVGIMMDDVIAGILSLFVTQSLVYFMG